VTESPALAHAVVVNMPWCFWEGATLKAIGRRGVSDLLMFQYTTGRRGLVVVDTRSTAISNESSRQEKECELCQAA
jgi:hypothetical protein